MRITINIQDYVVATSCIVVVVEVVVVVVIVVVVVVGVVVLVVVVVVSSYSSMQSSRRSRQISYYTYLKELSPKVRRKHASILIKKRREIFTNNF